MNAMTCPHCGHMVDAHAEAYRGGGLRRGVEPRSGDYSVCIYCAEVGVFRLTHYGMGLVLPSPAEQQVIALDDGLARIVDVIRRTS